MAVNFKNVEILKKVPLENVPRIPYVKYLSPKLNRKKRQTITHRHNKDTQTGGGHDNT